MRSPAVELYFRKLNKWAKVSGNRGRWTCAKGWKGELKATTSQRYDRKEAAKTAARNWVDDQP